MDLSVTIISSIALGLIYVFIIKPRRDKKAAKTQMDQERTNASCAERRFYFYNDHCSFKLDSDIIKSEEEGGEKFILKTEKIEAVMWIIPEMPIHSRYPWIVGTEEMEVGGFHCEVAYTKTPLGIIPSYFIDCGDFVVQVNLPNKNTKEETEFINSFRLEK